MPVTPCGRTGTKKREFMNKLIRMLEAAIVDEKEAIAFYDKLLRQVDALQTWSEYKEAKTEQALNSIGRNIANIKDQESKHLAYFQDLLYSILKGVTPPRKII